MKAKLVLLITMLILANLAAVGSSTEIRRRVVAIDAPHPRLFFTEPQEEAMREKIHSDPLLTAVFEHVVATAEALKDKDTLTRDQVGKRLLGVSRECLERVSYLAFAYRMNGDESLLRRAEAEMLAVSGFSDWNPSHFLDVAEMTAALAIGYDWLYDGLTPEARTAIREAIVEKGLRTSLKGGGWVTTTNNWNQVCHGGLTLGALAVVEDAPELAQDIVARAIENVPTAMKEYAPDGVYPEGASYWKYGTSYNVLLLAALESVLDTDFGLTEQPGFMESPEFYLHVTGPTGLFYNFSDCSATSGLSEAMHWFAQKLDRPGLLWHEREALQEFAAKDPADRSGGRLLPFLLVWGQPMSDLEPPQQFHWHGDGRTPVAMFRSAWADNAAYLGIKGGSPGTNHAHMDIGSFVLDRDGVRWAIDLGAQDYHSLESKGIGLWNRSQDSERWEVFRLNSLSHNTLVVNGELQRVKGDAPITGFSDDPAKPYTIIDMTPVYEGQLASAQRGVRLMGRDVLLQDEIEASGQDAHIRWGMATKAELDIAIDAPNTATLTQDGKSLLLRVLAPSEAVLQVYDMENPEPDFNATNPNTRMIGFEIDVPAGAEQRLVVVMSGVVPPSVTVEPLAEW